MKKSQSISEATGKASTCMHGSLGLVEGLLELDIAESDMWNLSYDEAEVYQLSNAARQVRRSQLQP